MTEKKGGGVSVTIPKRSAGRALDAVVDMFRPFSEKQGLKADQIRLQREDVLIEIAKRAKERLAIENATIKPVPNKLLVPLIEAASTENLEDTTMIDMWASLLASAASSDQVQPRFIGVLKELQGRQAQLLYQVAKNAWSDVEHPETALSNAPTDLQVTIVRRFILPRAIEAAKSKKGGYDYDQYRNNLSEDLDRPGCALIDASLWTNDGDVYNVNIGESSFNDLNQEIDFAILASLGLCERVYENFQTKNGYEFYLEYYYITALGVAFLAQCTPEFNGIKEELDEISKFKPPQENTKPS